MNERFGTTVPLAKILAQGLWWSPPALEQTIRFGRQRDNLLNLDAPGEVPVVSPNATASNPGNKLMTAFAGDVPSAEGMMTKRRCRVTPAYIPDDPLLTAKEGARERPQARSTFWRDVAAGKVPPPYYVSPRCPRWRLSELRAAVDACRAPEKARAL
jgi:predicted DNA-binding transcriptional regulator AlpA